MMLALLALTTTTKCKKGKGDGVLVDVTQENTRKRVAPILVQYEEKFRRHPIKRLTRRLDNVVHRTGASRAYVFLWHVALHCLFLS